MLNTVYKINDQDPLYNTMKLTPHSVITYMEKKKIYTHYVLTEVKQGVVERKGRKKKHQQDSNSPIYSSSNGGKNEKEMLTLIRETNVKNRLLDSVGEGECGMI